MNRFIAVLASSALTVGLLAATPTSADARTRCTTSGNGASRTCYSVTHVTTRNYTIETTVSRNEKGSRENVIATCGFDRDYTQTASITSTDGWAIKGGLELTLFKVAKVSFEVEHNFSTSRTVSQSGTKATKMTATATLRPGYKLVCKRKDVLVSALITQTYYNGATKRVRKFNIGGTPVKKIVVSSKVVKIK